MFSSCQLRNYTHTLNAVFLLLDTVPIACRFLCSGLHILFCGAAFTFFFQWVVHACCISWWPYNFLHLNSPWSPSRYFAFAVAHFPCYGIYALVKVKNSVLLQLFPNAF
ncbi:hypothetical protein SLA2020_166750 [Shorea laevis]